MTVLHDVDAACPSGGELGWTYTFVDIFVLWKWRRNKPTRRFGGGGGRLWWLSRATILMWTQPPAILGLPATSAYEHAPRLNTVVDEQTRGTTRQTARVKLALSSLVPVSTIH